MVYGNELKILLIFHKIVILGHAKCAEKKKFKVRSILVIKYLKESIKVNYNIYRAWAAWQSL